MNLIRVHDFIPYSAVDLIVYLSFLSRLVHREIDDIAYAQIVQKIDIETAKKMKLDQLAAKHLKEEENERELKAVRDLGNSSSDNIMEISQEAPNPISATQPNMQISGHLTSPQDVAQHGHQREFKQPQQKVSLYPLAYRNKHASKFRTTT